MPNRYSITSEIRDGVELFRLQDAEKAYVEIAPALGNNCFVFKTTQDILEAVPFDEFLSRAKSY